MIEQATEISGTFTLLLGLISGISLLVGGIVNMNIMLNYVSEHKQEIGLRKAVEARIDKHTMSSVLYVLSILCFLLLLPANARSQNNKGSIEGRVVDRTTQQPLPGANIIVEGTPMGAAADLDGNYFIKNVPMGTYQIKVSMIGYQVEVKTDVAVSTNRVTMVNFELKPKILEGEEVMVTAGYFDKDGDTPVSAKSLTPREIRSSAGSTEDIFRVIQSMPGVSVAGGRSANLVVRGGAPDENLTLLDNIEIYSPLHFSRSGSSMGFISIINPSLLEGVDFLTGGFPAKYGDKMSSVLKCNSKKATEPVIIPIVNVNLGGFGLFLDGPLPGGGSLVFSGRRGFFDLITSAMNRPVAPQYWDFVSKASYNLGAKHNFSLVGFYYLDQIDKTGSVSTGPSESGMKYDYINLDNYGGAVGVNWRYLFSPRGYMLTTAAVTENGWNSVHTRRFSSVYHFRNGIAV